MHAAGTNHEWCSDYMVSSYTPTLGALIDARGSYGTRSSNDKLTMLLSGVPRPEQGWKELVSISEELSEVARTVPSDVLISPPAAGDTHDLLVAGLNAQTILDLLPHTHIFHIACHARQDAEDPLKSGFVMQDRMLTISELISVRATDGLFAFLSACDTAKGDMYQPNQVVHLAATMLFSGFKSVIATMWYGPAMV
jgi:CHAT domain-containing protein